MEFERDFSVHPRIEIEDQGRFAIVFEGKADAKNWKDWAVYMINDVLKVFSEVKFERFEQPDDLSRPSRRS
ncbi:hypothetical protein LZC95_09345 [Pendulispora brunnea]|uniref:Uncharacterized protein n=1 Tax=Pendulispora brunnea TaxID=2905690 RepID=A0ABZ2KEG2_9BACT